MRRQYAAAERRAKIYSGEYDTPSERVCKECGRKFLSIYEKKFCSPACKKQYRIKTAKCKRCGKLLNYVGIFTVRGYCSDECRHLDQIDAAMDRGDYLPCEFCGKMFISKNYANVCCSKECCNALRQREIEARQRKLGF